MALNAIIFDLDGTLIDSNASHIEAWLKALATHRYHVSPDRIAVEIGKGGDHLVPSVLGEAIEKTHGESLREAHSTEFARIANSTSLKVFPGVKELLAELRRRGFKTALATSSDRHHLELTQKSANVDLTQWFDEIITAEDVSKSKPSPDVLTVAVSKLKIFPAQAIMIGDTPHDIVASRDAGLVCLGLLCGDLNDCEKLRSSGARAVYRDAADLLAHLDEALKTASPGSAHLDQPLIESLMRVALVVALDGMEHGEAPIGAVLANGDGTIIARGYNELNESKNKTAHAEIVAFARAAGRSSPEARDLILVSTLEPCVMCLGAAMEAAIDTVLYALAAPADGGTSRVSPPVSPESQMPRVIGGVLADESRQLFKEFLRRRPDSPAQVAFAKQLLESTH